MSYQKESDDAMMGCGLIFLIGLVIVGIILTALVVGGVFYFFG